MDCQITCAWCGRHMGVKDFDIDVMATARKKTAVSHGICHACLRTMLRRAMQSTVPASMASR